LDNEIKQSLRNRHVALGVASGATARERRMRAALELVERRCDRSIEIGVELARHDHAAASADAGVYEAAFVRATARPVYVEQAHLEARREPREALAEALDLAIDGRA
jgi:antitoxin component HigA of HigAB toxin-antitoxin module